MEGHTGDSFSSQEQAGVCGGGGCQAAQHCSGSLARGSSAAVWVCLPHQSACVEDGTVPSALLQPPALLSSITGFLKFQSCFL